MVQPQILAPGQGRPPSILLYASLTLLLHPLYPPMSAGPSLPVERFHEVYQRHHGVSSLAYRLAPGLLYASVKSGKLANKEDGERIIPNEDSGASVALRLIRKTVY